MKKSSSRALIEVGFIIFLFYSNLFMGEFERSGPGWNKGMLWAINDIVTPGNFIIALITGFFAHVLFEFLRTKL